MYETRAKEAEVVFTIGTFTATAAENRDTDSIVLINIILTI